jgi:hypothetical protein
MLYTEELVPHKPGSGHTLRFTTGVVGPDLSAGDPTGRVPSAPATTGSVVPHRRGWPSIDAVTLSATSTVHRGVTDVVGEDDISG